MFCSLGDVAQAAGGGRFRPGAGGSADGASSRGGGEPGAVLDRLAELGWPVILGSTDQFSLDGPSDLSERRLAQIGTFLPTYERDGLLAFHGSPRDFDDILPLLAGGHTHDRRALEHAGHAIVDGESVEFRRCGS